jgi:ABC-type Mn2+/Zn2+ transport system ATPase subunit
MVTGADAYAGGSGHSSVTERALEVRHLTISFDGVPIIKDVSFTVAAGDSLAIIGPTGSGKTVLFRALIGALPYEGDIRWAPAARVGYVPQKLDIERDLPITGNDFLLGKAHVARASKGDVRRALELVNLTRAMARKPIGTLSGGQSGSCWHLPSSGARVYFSLTSGPPGSSQARNDCTNGSIA